MKYVEKNIDFKVSQFDLTLIPKEITIHGTQAQFYALQLCKGPQIVKKIGQVISVNASEFNYKFLDGESVGLKLQSQKSMVYDWTLYKITDNDQRDFIGSVSLNLASTFNSYLQNIKKYSKECVKLINAQQLGQNIANEWLEIKEQIRDQFDIHSKNAQLKLELHCKLIVKCELDRLVEEEIIRMKEKRLAKTNSKNSFQSKISAISAIEESNRLIPEIPSASEYTTIKNQQVSYLVVQPLASPKEVLSDIVEVSVSNEYSSNLNFGDRGSKMPEGMSQAVDGIPQEDHEISSPYRTATQNYQKIEINEEINNLIRCRSKSNISDANLNKESQIKPSVLHKNLKNSYESLRGGESYEVGESELTKGSQNAVNSQLTPNIQQAEHLPLKSNIQQPTTNYGKGTSFSSIKGVCVLLFLIVLSLGSLYELTNFSEWGLEKQKTQNRQQIRKKGQKGKKKPRQTKEEKRRGREPQTNTKQQRKRQKIIQKQSIRKAQSKQKTKI